MTTKSDAIERMAIMFGMQDNSIHDITIPELNKNRKRYETNAERYFKSIVKPKIKFIKQFQVLIFCLQTPEGFVFTWHGETIFISNRKTKENAWKDFVSNYWYLKSNENFRMEVWIEFSSIVKQSKQL